MYWRAASATRKYFTITYGWQWWNAVVLFIWSDRTRRFSALGEFTNSRDFFTIHVNSRDLYITCQILFLSGQICPQLHIIYALFSLIPTYENIQKYIPYSTILCPVTSERYSDVTGHLPGDRQTKYDSIILYNKPKQPKSFITVHQVTIMLFSIHS